MKKLIPGLLMLGVLVSATTLIPNEKPTAQTIRGTTANTYGSYTYAYGWTWESGTCHVRTFLADVQSEDIGEGFAQSPQISVQIRNIHASSDHWVDGNYRGYTQSP